MYIVLIFILISAIAILIRSIRQQKKKLQTAKLSAELSLNSERSFQTTSNQALSHVYTIKSMSRPIQSQTDRIFQTTTTNTMSSDNRCSNNSQNLNPSTSCGFQSAVNINQRHRLQQQIDNSLSSTNQYPSNSNSTVPSAPPLICSQPGLEDEKQINLDLPPPYPGISTTV